MDAIAKKFFVKLTQKTKFANSSNFIVIPKFYQNSTARNSLQCHYPRFLHNIGPSCILCAEIGILFFTWAVQ